MPSSLSTEHSSADSSAEQPALPAHASPASTGLPNDASQHPQPGSSLAPPADGKPRRSWTRLLVVFLVLAALVGLVVYRIRSNKKADQQQAQGAAAMANRPVPVAFDVVQQRPIPIFLSALGTVTAYNTVTLKSRVDGQITRVNFREGQHVNQGQLLIEIDPRPYQATVEQAQGNLLRDQANAANAEAQAVRYNQLYSAGVVSKEQAQAQESTSGQATGTLAADRAAISSARVNLNYTRITSPISGIVGLRQVDIGNIVAANSSTGLVVITQVEPIAVIFTLPEDQLPQVFEHMKGGHTLAVEAWDRSNLKKLASGTLLTVDNEIDTTTGTAKLKAVFDNRDGALYPNQFVNVRLVVENRTNAITIPAAAVQTGSQGSFVYVIDSDHPISPDQTAAAASQATRGGGKKGGKAGTAGSETNPSGGSESSSGSGSSGAGGTGTRHGGGAGAATSMRQTSYPVQERPIQIDLTQGNIVVVHSGVRPGEKVITDGEEKLSLNSKVIPRPARQVDYTGIGNASVAGGQQQGAGATRLGSQTGTANAEGSNTTGANGQGGQSNQQGTNTGTGGGAPRQ